MRAAADDAVVDIFDAASTANLLEALTKAQRAIVSAFVQGVKAQESIAAADQPDEKE